MNIAEILKNVPKGTKLYSPMFGDVFLILSLRGFIRIHTGNPNCTYEFNAEGKYQEHGECMLFPSRENRDWNTFNKFDINSLKPFDKVLVRNDYIDTWNCEFYSHYTGIGAYGYVCVGNAYNQCIPYNDETKHIVGTDKDCPEYYKTW